MLIKLAFRNVRRSARDYAIYFVTLALSVAIFYAFNAISTQSVLFDAFSTSIQRAIDMLKLFMGLFSIVVALVLSFLVLYANRFLIRRRKHEFGTYLMLGMGPARVTRILFYETLIVGAASLVAGLALGIIISQGFSFLTAALMEITMGNYHFIVSIQSICLTIICFALIFLLAAAVNIIYINHCRLASLLSPHAISERSLKQHPIFSATASLAALICIGLAYWQLHVNAFIGFDIHFAAATILMVLGTFLFFWSASSAILSFFQGWKRLYFKGLSMFTLRQISSKANTAFVSVSVVSIMLFFGITVMSCGFGFAHLFVENLEEATRFDATLQNCIGSAFSNSSEGSMRSTDAESVAAFQQYEGDTAAYLAEKYPAWDSFVQDSAQLDYYCSGTYADIFSHMSEAPSSGDARTDEAIAQTALILLSESQFNKAMALIGEEPISLDEGECAINNGSDYLLDVAEKVCAEQARVDIAGKTLHCQKSLVRQPLRTSAVPDTMLEIIVPDEVIENLKAQGVQSSYGYLNLAYSCSREEGDQMLCRALAQAQPLPEGNTPDSVNLDECFQESAWPVWSAYTAQDMIDQAKGFKTSVTYLALYIGFVLLMATCTILAIQQLSETVDATPRYRRLETLGCESKSILRSLRIQTAVYFLAPLVLASCHAACAIHEIDSVILEELGSSIGGPLTLAAIIVGFIYLIYLLVTYSISASTISSEGSHRTL